jgi:hypothetical protein
VPNTIQVLTAAIGRVLEDLNGVIGIASGSKGFVNALGWDLPAGVDDIGLAALDFTDVLEKLQRVVKPSRADAADELAMAARVAELAAAIAAAADSIDELAESLPATLSGFDDYVDRTNIHEELPRRALDLLIVNHLYHAAPIATAVLKLLAIIELEYFPADPPNFQREHLRTIVHYDALESFLTDPAGHLATAYGWGTPEFADLDLLERTGQLLRFLGVPVQLRLMDRRAEAALLGVAPLDPNVTPVPQMDVTLFEQVGEAAGLKLGVAAFGVRPSAPGATDAGVGFVPVVRGQVDTSLPFPGLGNTFLDVSAEGDLLRRLALILRAGQDLDIRHAAGVSDAVTGRFALGLRGGQPTSDRRTLLSFPGGVAIEAQQVSIQGGIEKRSDRPPEGFVELGVLGARVAFSLDQADAFLQQSIAQKTVEGGFDFRVGWTSEQGIYFHGSSALVVTLPAHAEVGPFSLSSVTIGLAFDGAGLTLESSVSGSLALGPLVAVVERVGLDLRISFERGNLGLFGLSPDFKPPTGIGLSVDGGGFKGGGFLRFEPEQGRYAGLLELEFGDQFTLKAIGLLNTRLPDGRRGFSLLIVISAEFTPIQLGFGFRLDGVGGLLGLHRTVTVDRLVTGLRDNTLRSILFPTDIVANADRILSDLQQVFPPARGRFLFGPMAKISWGTPPLLTADVGLIVEVPEPIRVSILGVVRGILPTESTAILKLQVNFLGVLEFAQQYFSFDASLFESKLLAFTLTGDMALRLTWGAEPNFLQSVGGFHPAYQPPPLRLPALRRLTVALLDGDNPRLTLETYFAVTSNSVQVGARVELYASAWKFTAYGFLSFDALFQFNPFRFIAEVTVMLALKAGNSTIASIKLTLTLEGTTPWKAKGEAQLKLCWFLTVKVRFNRTFGESRLTTLPDLLVLPLLIEALQARDNWEGELPANRHRLESLREAAPGAEEVRVHPIGTLKISQKVAPLNVAVDRIGSQRPADGQTFAIAGVQVGSGGVSTGPAQDLFAPAQFFAMTDAEKLASASFATFDSGVRAGDDRPHTGYAAAREVQYELKYIDSQRNQRLTRSGGLVVVDVTSFHTWTLQGAIAASELSFARRRKSPLAPEDVATRPERFAVVRAADLQPFDDDSVMGAERSAWARRDALIAANPALRGALQVVPVFEMSA